MRLPQHQGCDSHRELSRSRRGQEIIPSVPRWVLPLRPSLTHRDAANRAQRTGRTCPKGKGRAFLEGRDTPCSGEIPSETNNSPGKDNNSSQLFSGRAVRIPTAVPSPGGSPAPQTPSQGRGQFAGDVPKRSTQAGKAHKAPRGRGSLQLSSEKSAWPFLSEPPHPLGKHNNSSASLHRALWELEPRA